MEWRCAGCFIERFAGKVCPNTSARIMIRCIDSTNGKPIFENSESPKSRRFLMCRFRIPSYERLIGTVRREYLDRILFWTTADLETKLFDFQRYYNGHRTHAGLEGRLTEPRVEGPASPSDFARTTGPASSISFTSYGWQKHCRGLYQTPIAA